MAELDSLRSLIPLLIPIILIQLGLMIFALVDLARRPRVRGPKWAWAVVILLFNLVGPIVYLVVARDDSY